MTKRNPTIVIFAAHFPPSPGGISKFMGITVNALAEQGCKVIVVTSDFDNPDPSHPNIKLIRLPVHTTWPGGERYPIPIRSKIKDILKPLESEQIDRVVALTRFHPSSHVAATFAQKNNIPFYLLECGANLLTVNNKLLDIPLRLVERALTARIRKKVTRWGAMSSAGNDFLKKQYNIDGKFTWPCSINVPNKVIKTTNNNEVVITYSGRIENLKGEEEIASNFVKLVKKYPNIKLNFLGNGSYLPALKKKYPQSNIKYWGNVTPSVVNQVNLATDIFVCATRFPDGAVPNAVLEAGSAKCAGITSPNGGFTELIKDNHNGLLTRPDLSDMGECLERLITDADLRRTLAENLYTDIKKRYQPNMVAKRILRDLELA